jgi:uncharacterized protein
MFELALGFGIVVVLIAFVSEFIDSTLGMGYGTMLTPVLLIMGFSPMQVVPAVLLSELVTGVLAGALHSRVGNVDFRLASKNPKVILKKLSQLGLKESIVKGLPLHLRVSLLIALCSILGTVAAVVVAVNLPKFYLQLYIGVLVLMIGGFILFTLNKQYRFSWRKVTLLGLIASFNKGISGGGYGPVVTGGQLLSGVEGKSAIGITSLAEGLTCLVGVIVYLVLGKGLGSLLAPYLMIGAVASVPLSALAVRQMRTTKLRLLIGLATVALGSFSILKLVL